MAYSSRQFILAERPAAEPGPECFRLVDATLPEPADGEIVVRNTHLSVDPYMRPRMDDRPSYVPPYVVGDPLDGGAVGVVIASEDPSTPVGSTVRHGSGWRDVALLAGRHASIVDTTAVPASYHLGILGMPGMTAYAGLRAVADLQDGDVVFVSGAAGAVGSLAGQFARLLGASRVVGSAGGEAKARFVEDDLGFDACLDYRAGDLLPRLREAAPDGVDVYFDNVGGEHFAAALQVMRRNGRIAMSGVISDYNAPIDERVLRADMFQVIGRRLTIRGFISTDHADLRDAFTADVTGWLATGALMYRETVAEGLESTPTAFLDMLKGGNVGKAIVALGEG